MRQCPTCNSNRHIRAIDKFNALWCPKCNKTTPIMPQKVAYAHGELGSKSAREQHEYRERKKTRGMK